MDNVAFFTMDVESFFDTSCIKENHIPFDSTYDAEDGLYAYLELLDDYGVKATLFLTVDTASRWQTPLKEAMANGHKLAVHALNHEDVTQVSDERFLYDITEAKKRIEDIYGCEMLGYRAPCFGISEQKMALLKGVGYKYDSSALNCNGALRSGYLPLNDYKKINDVVYEKDGFFEFKPCVRKTALGQIPVCGGAYLRLLPRFATNKIIQGHIKESNAYLFYLHPFEISCHEFPKYKELPWTDRMYIARGREGYRTTVRNIIERLIDSNYHFVTMDDYVRRFVNG